MVVAHHDVGRQVGTIGACQSDQQLKEGGPALGLHYAEGMSMHF